MAVVGSSRQRSSVVGTASASAGPSTPCSRLLVELRYRNTTTAKGGSTIADRTLGGMSEWLKEADCKSAGSAYAGSNPAPPTILRKVETPVLQEGPGFRRLGRNACAAS